MILAHAKTPAGKAILKQATEVKRQLVPEHKLEEHVTALQADETKMAGQLLPCKGDACPHVLPVPPFARGIGDDINGNQVRLTAAQMCRKDRLKHAEYLS
jgi:hypothetical protein